MRIGASLGRGFVPSGLLGFRGGGELGLKLGNARFGLALSFLHERARLNAQIGHLGIVGGQGFLQALVRLGARKRHGFALGNIARKLCSTYLTDDIGIARLVDLKHLATVRALDLVHGAPLRWLALIRQHTAPRGHSHAR